MARESTARQFIEPEEGERRRAPRFGGEGPTEPPIVAQEPVVSNARLALIMFIAAEAMFFAGLIGAFLVLRLGKPVWPPPFQPRLPVMVTGINTMILLLSGITMHLGLRAIRAGRSNRIVPWLSATLFLGALFLSIQGYEWARLVGFGLTVSSGIYGATFYVLIGCHALHVLGAVVWLAVVLLQARKERVAITGVELCAIYWTFVVALWPILYALVYF